MNFHFWQSDSEKNVKKIKNFAFLEFRCIIKMSRRNSQIFLKGVLK